MTSDRRRLGRVHPVFCLCEQADPAVVLNDNNSVLVTSNRLQDGSVPPLEQGMVVGQLVLADALIVGNCNNQVLTRWAQNLTGTRYLWQLSAGYLLGSESFHTTTGTKLETSLFLSENKQFPPQVEQKDSSEPTRIRLNLHSRNDGAESFILTQSDLLSLMLLLPAGQVQ